MNESYHTRVVNGTCYMSKDDYPQLGNQLPQNRVRRFESNSTLLRTLHDRKKYLLQIVEDWYDCPDTYRNSLYKILFVIDISQKEAFDQLNVIKPEAGNLEFNLQLDPAWIRNLLRLVNELIEQTKQKQRKQSTPGLDHLIKRLNLLINTSNRYRLTKLI